MPVNVSVGTAGTASFTWSGVPADEIWTGAVSVPLAVPSSVLPILWSAFDGGTPIGQWYNSQSSGPLQVNTQLQVTGSGITPGALVATLQGIATDLASAPPWWPAPTPAPPPAAPRVIFNSFPAAVTLPGNVQTPLITNTPVVLGTSIGIESYRASTPTSLVIQWSDADAIGPLFTFDIATFTFMQGLTLPNLAPFVTVAVNNGAAPGNVQVKISTGLPPITRGPMQQGGDLTRFNAAIADGADSGLITLPPYVGDAQIFLTALVAGASPPAGAIFAILRSQDYLGTSSELGRVGATTQFLAASGTTSLQPGYIWKMSPRINSIQVYNRIGGGTAVSVDMAISVSGP
jgi:hypothetical protein